MAEADGGGEDPRDEELMDLWHRRPTLDERGWTRLYVLVFDVLRKLQPVELRRLPREDREVYVYEFWEDRIFFNSGSGTELTNGCRTLITAYRNYLRYRCRYWEVRGTTSIDDSGDNDDDRSFLETYEPPDEETWESVLREHQLKVDDVLRKATNWIGSVPPWVPLYLALSVAPEGPKEKVTREDLQLLYALATDSGLKFDTGKGEAGLAARFKKAKRVKIATEEYQMLYLLADRLGIKLENEKKEFKIDATAAMDSNIAKDRLPHFIRILARFGRKVEAPIALVNLAKRMNVPNHHNKARQLGLTKDVLRSRPGFEKSMLGRWLVDEVNLEIWPENAPALAIALKILFGEALVWVKEQGSSK